MPVSIGTLTVRDQNMFSEWLDFAKQSYGEDTEIYVKNNTIILDSEEFRQELERLENSVSRYYQNKRYTGD